MNLKHLLKTTALTALLLIGAKVGWGQVSLTTFGNAYTQDFNTLAITGTTNAWSDNTTIVGWYSNRTVYIADDGASNSGGLRSYGTTSSTERALGGIGSSSAAVIYYACRFVNNTGSTITELSISFDGEQWRNGGNTSTQPLNFSYQVGATAITTGTWTNVSQLLFTSPIATSTAAALDGNNASNRIAGISYAISGLNVANGQEIWIRWEDINDSGNDHGLAIDNLSVTAVADTKAPQATFDPADAATKIAVNKDITITFNEAIRNIDDSPITDANVASLLVVKETDENGTDVPFTATIDATKKVITINPTSDLTVNTPYYVSIAPIEDELNNASTLKSIIFRTVDPTAPDISNITITEASPYYAGNNITVNWTSANVDLVKIEVWTPSSTWIELKNSTDATDGSEVVALPSDLAYGTTYKVKVSYVTNPLIFAETGSSFTVIVIFDTVS